MNLLSWVLAIAAAALLAWSAYVNAHRLRYLLAAGAADLFVFASFASAVLDRNLVTTGIFAASTVAAFIYAYRTASGAWQLDRNN